MPQLPSGRHVAVDTLPLAELLRTWNLDESRKKLVGLITVEDLHPLTRILELVPAQSVDEPVAIVGKSLVPPEAMAIRDTGFRLSDCPDGLPHWSDQDREAFRAYRDTRVPEYLSGQLKEAKSQDAANTRSFLDALEAAWMKAGVHPSQESGWDDLPAKAQVDVFEQLLALVQCWCAISVAQEGEVSRTSAVDRLEGFLSMAAGALPWLPKTVPPMAPTSLLADSLRTTVGVDAFPADRRDWWIAQVHIECDNLFNDSSLEAFLKQHATKAYGFVIYSSIHAANAT